MRSCLVLVLVLVACGNPRGPTELATFSNAGGGLIPCQAGDIWCSYDGDNFGGTLQITSRSTAMRAEGMLTQSSLEELDRLASAIAYDTPRDRFVCADSPRKTIELDFLPEGRATFHYDCDPGPLTELDNFLDAAVGDLMACETTSFRFIQIQCF